MILPENFLTKNPFIQSLINAFIISIHIFWEIKLLSPIPDDMKHRGVWLRDNV
jgi:large-conductance mechanosensitive channel